MVEIEGTQTVMGDIPLDALGAAVGEVVSSYEAALGRRPTKGEWEALLFAVLGSEEESARVMVDHVCSDPTMLKEPWPHGQGASPGLH